NKAALIERRDRFQYLHLFVPDGFAVGSDWRIHSQVRQDLEQMILYYVADRAGLVVKGAAALDSEVFGHSDLDTFDMRAIPERLQERVRESGIKHVVDGPLAQEVI